MAAKSKKRPRRYPAGRALHAVLSNAALTALRDRVNRLEQLCYAQVRRINALQAEVDHMQARKRESSR